MNKIMCVYGVFNSENQCLYVGSTNDFATRKIHHKSFCNNPKHHNYNMKLYQFIRCNGGFEKFHFEIIQVVDNRDELRAAERCYMKKYKPPLNTYDVNVDARHSTKWQTRSTLKSRHKHLESYKRRYRNYMNRKCINPITNEVQNLGTVRGYLYRHKIKISIKDLQFI